MNYDGGKNGAGVWQTIINEMPPHHRYFEGFLGSAAVMRRKRPAVINIGVEIDPVTIAAVKPFLSPVHDVVEANFIEWLPTVKIFADDLIYCDPPYLKHVRTSQRPLYRKEFWTVDEHTQLLQLAKSSPAMWIISGYWSELYVDMLKGWRSLTYQAQTRAGMRTEWLWCNFPAPVALHDYAVVGSDKTERQRIKRKIGRWRTKLLKMSTLERGAVLRACREVEAELQEMPAAQLISTSQDPQPATSARTCNA